jgi:hypothetical protein
MPTLRLYHFRYLDPIRHKWLLARYVAQHDVIVQRYTQFQIIGEPEVRQYADESRTTFNPFTLGDLSRRAIKKEQV